MSEARKYISTEEARKRVICAPSVLATGLSRRGERVIFADESSYNRGRIRGACLVSLAAEDLPRVEEQITSLPNFDKINDFKWERVRSGDSVQIATDLLTLALRLSSRHVIEVDPIVWDAHDPANQKARTRLADVYAQAIRNVLLRHDGFQLNWMLFPDEMLGMDWQMLRKRLNDSALDVQHIQNSYGNGIQVGKVIRRVHDYMIRKVVPCDSAKNPVVWIADLMAGMARLMHEQIYDNQEQKYWLKAEPTNSEKARSLLLQNVLNLGLSYNPVPHEQGLRSATGPRFRVYEPDGF